MSLSILSDIAAHGEASGTEWLVALHDGVAPGDRHVIHHPLVHVALMDPLPQELQFGYVIVLFGSVLLCTQPRTGHVLTK